MILAPPLALAPAPAASLHALAGQKDASPLKGRYAFFQICWLKPAAVHQPRPHCAAHTQTHAPCPWPMPMLLPMLSMLHYFCSYCYLFLVPLWHMTLHCVLTPPECAGLHRYDCGACRATCTGLCAWRHAVHALQVGRSGFDNRSTQSQLKQAQGNGKVHTAYVRRVLCAQ